MNTVWGGHSRGRDQELTAGQLVSGQRNRPMYYVVDCLVEVFCAPQHLLQELCDQQYDM